MGITTAKQTKFQKPIQSNPIQSNTMSSNRFEPLFQNLCTGCFPICQPNQEAHWQPGGCLEFASLREIELEGIYTSDPNWTSEASSETASESSETTESESSEATVSESSEATVSETASEATASEAPEEAPEEEKRNLAEPLVQPLFALPCGFEFPECPICFDTIEMVNVTVTTCGHSFHASCAFRSLETSENCPMCRNQLVEFQGDEEDEGEGEDEDEEEGEDGDQEDEDEEEEDAKVTLEQLTGKLSGLGYTMADLLKYFLSDIKSSKNEEKYTEEFDVKLYNDIDGILDGTIPLSSRDTRSYAAVVASRET